MEFVAIVPIWFAAHLYWILEAMRVASIDGLL